MSLSALRKVVSLETDEGRLEAAGADHGRIVHRIPRAVAAPRSVADVRRLLEAAARTQVPVAIRGAGHSMGGQSLTGSGVVLDLKGLNRIGDIEAGAVRVQGGALWRDVVRRVYPQGWLPVVLTGNLDTTVGGTLSTTGGLGASSHVYGSQADNVLRLEVVLGDGRLVRCSPEENRAVFDCARCGLGQFAAITEAHVRLRRAPRNVRVFFLVYDDLDTLAEDQEALLRDGRVPYVEAWYVAEDAKTLRSAAMARPSGECFVMRLAVEFDDGSDPGGLPEGLVRRRPVHVMDCSMLAFSDQLGRQSSVWDAVAGLQFARPWMTVLLPWRNVTAHFAAILEDLPVELRSGQQKPIRLKPLRNAVLGSPLFMLPDGEFSLEFALMPAVPPDALPRVLPAIAKAYRRLNDLGGKAGLLGWIDYDHEQWKAHFADQWPRMLEWKAQCDPHGILDGEFVRHARAK